MYLNSRVERECVLGPGTINLYKKFDMGSNNSFAQKSTKSCLQKSNFAVL